MKSVFELIMLVMFGISWPVSIIKSYRARTVGSKSIVFLVAVLVGYIAGIIGKCIYDFNYVTVVYFINAAMVSTDIVFYFRNRRLDRERAEKGESLHA